MTLQLKVSRPAINTADEPYLMCVGNQFSALQQGLLYTTLRLAQDAFKTAPHWETSFV